MRHFHLQRNQYFKPTINLNKLWNLVPKDTPSSKDHAVVIDVVKAVSGVFNNNRFFSQGYFKVLGAGALPNKPFVVRAKEFSRLAEKRIKAAGGACELRA